MSADLAIRYDAPPTVGRFLGSDAFVRLIVGPIGSGKSSGCIIEILRRAMDVTPCLDGIRRSRCVVIRNTYRELADTTIKTFEQWIPPDLGVWHHGDNTFVIRFEDVECEVMFRALDRPDQVKKLLSLEITFAYVNEAKEIPRVIFDTVQSRLGRYPSRKDLPPGATYWHGMWADTNPPDTDHYLYRIFEEQRPEGFELFHQPGGLEPDAENVENLPPGYYARLIAGKDSDWVNVYVHAKYGFVRDGRPIYPEWSDRLHVDETIRARPDLDLLLGQDFGLTPAAVLAQRDPLDGQLQVFDELVATDMGAVSFGRELHAKILREYPDRALRGWGDPAGEQRAQTDETTPFEIMAAAKVPLSPAPTNDFTRRREAVAGMLLRNTMRARAALAVHPRCKILRKAMASGYCYKRLAVAGGERFADKPDKNEFSHVAEALQYLAVGEGEDSRAIYGTERRRVSVSVNVKRSVGAGSRGPGGFHVRRSVGGG